MSCWMSSSRVQTTFTGPSTCCATLTAWATPSTSSRRPKPPPSRWLWTCTFSFGRPVISAAMPWAMVGTWVPTQISQLSGLHMDRAVHRLHRRMGQERHLVDRPRAAAPRRPAPCRRRPRCGATAPGFFNSSSSAPDDVGAADLGVRAVVPLRPRAPRAPSWRRPYGRRPRPRPRRSSTTWRTPLTAIAAASSTVFGLPPSDRRDRDRRDLHARQLDVDAEYRPCR